MVSYYERKVQLYTLVDEIIKKGRIDRDFLARKVNRVTGFSKRSIQEYINDLIEDEKVAIKTGMLSWKK